jgi:hypothetical protein
MMHNFPSFPHYHQKRVKLKIARKWWSAELSDNLYRKELTP